MEAKKWYTFDDVALLPSYSTLESRLDPNLTTKLTCKTNVALPFIPSPMSSVIGLKLGKQLVKNQIYPIFHRFYKDPTELTDWINEIGNNGYISWGLDYLNVLVAIFQDPIYKPKGVCFDVAHGHCKKMKEAIEYFKTWHPDVEVIAGTICTPTAAIDLVRWGADAIRVGIGAGSACTTRLVTGFGAPQFSTIHECSLALKRIKSDVPIIADGGIRNSRDIALALAAGASTVMLGKLFASTEESAAEYIDISKKYKIYKGQASSEFQKTGRASEGHSGLVEVKGTVDELLTELSENLRTSLSYAGAANVRHFQIAARWVEVTRNYWDESQTRFDK